MPLTALDPNTALIVIDLQQGILAYATTQPVADVVRQANALAAAFRRHGLPVVLVTAAGSAPGRTEQPGRAVGRAPGWTDFLPELDRQPDDHVVTKWTRGAFTNTDLQAHLAARGVTQVVVVGIATSGGVESTARHAYELGFSVTLAIDAMTDISAEAHAHSIARVFPRLGETGTTQQIIDLLNARSG